MSIHKLLNYNLLHELGQGGMASVWYAENSVKRPFAIKLLKPELIAHEPSVPDRFRNEAQIMVKLDHPSVRRVEDYYEEGNILAIIMEYLDGQDLHRYIRKKGRVPEEQAISWFLKVLDAFGYVHKKGYFHRDVKPANLFLTTSGQVKVMDFGIAKIVGDDLSLTQTNSMMGSPLYMSPEQILSPKDVDYRTDIYSLGVTLYTLLAGNKPYDDQQQSSFNIQTAIVHQPLPLLLHISSTVNEAIQKATQKRPSDRFIDCNAFAQALTASTSAPASEEATIIHSPGRSKSPQSSPSVEEEVTQLRQTDNPIRKQPAHPTPLPSPTKQKPVIAEAPSTKVDEQTPSDAKSVTASPRSPLVWIIGIVLGVLAVGGGAYALLFKPATSPIVKLKTTTDKLSLPVTEIDEANGIRRGIGYYQQQNYDSAFALLTRYQATPAFQKNAEAMTNLGIIYYFGSDVIQPNLTKAKEWLEQGASLQNAKAHYYLGLLADGGDLKKTTTATGQTSEAVGHYREAAKGGDSFAQVTLGELYLANNSLVRQENPCTLLTYLEQASQDSDNKEAKPVLADFRKKNFCRQ